MILALQFLCTHIHWSFWPCDTPSFTPRNHFGFGQDWHYNPRTSARHLSISYQHKSNKGCQEEHTLTIIDIAIKKSFLICSYVPDPAQMLRRPFVVVKLLCPQQRPGSWECPTRDNKLGRKSGGTYRNHIRKTTLQWPIPKEWKSTHTKMVHNGASFGNGKG